jgi:spore germination cell wall hydrolase CwlJ-like protein
MLTQFKIMILSIFMAGNISSTDVNINMGNIANIKEVACLSQAIYGEAGNQPLQGKIAVAHVIMNRTKDEAFPETACGVIKQPGQFDFLSKVRKLKDEDDAVKAQMEESIKAAVLVMNEEVDDPTKGALFFANPKASTDKAWLKRLKKIVRIQDHVFYEMKKPAPRYTRVVKQSDKTLWAGD